jgi:ketosteroid isomerase-like protein
MTATTTDLPDVLPADLRLALDRVADALSAMFAGDPAPYAALWAPGAQPTLYGAWGPTEKGHDAVVRTFSWVATRFSDGARCRPRYETVDWSGDLAFTVGYEDTEVRIDAASPARMTLRVTHVLRRVDGEWRLVHRHADFPPQDPRG